MSKATRKSIDTWTTIQLKKNEKITQISTNAEEKLQIDQPMNSHLTKNNIKANFICKRQIKKPIDPKEIEIMWKKYKNQVEIHYTLKLQLD